MSLSRHNNSRDVVVDAHVVRRDALILRQGRSRSSGPVELASRFSRTRPCPRRGRATWWRAPGSDPRARAKRQVGLERRVEQSLREAERARRSRGEAARHVERGGQQVVGRRRRTGTRARGRRPPRRSRPRRASPSPWRGSPTSRGSRYAPPASATRPHFANVHMKRVRGCTNTKSHASARCAPGPTAAPFTAAIVGLSSSQSSRIIVCTPARSASEVARREAGLAGLGDGRRAEVHARAERVALAGDEHRAHLGSARNSRIASMMPSRIAIVSAFFASGRSSTIRPTPSGSRSTRRCVSVTSTSGS